MTRTALLMAGENIHGRLLLEKLIKRNLEPDIVINETNTERSKRLRTFLQNDVYCPPELHDFKLNVQHVNRFDSQDTVDILNKLNPSYIINGGCGIFRQNLLNITTILNVHPGLLPNFRGLDPVLWSLYYRQPVGATVHKISAGIDEGPIYIVKEIPWTYAKSLIELRIHCISWGADLLCDFLQDPKNYPEKAQEPNSGKYFSNFPEENIGLAEENLKFYIEYKGGNAFSCVERER